MKKIYLLMTLVILSIYTNAQNSSTTSNKTKTMNESMKPGEKVFIDNADKALSLIADAAQKISIKGVAIIAFIPGDSAQTWISKMKVVGNLSNDKVNFLAIAYTKASEMADTYKDSGTTKREIKLGELGYQGGVIKKANSGYVLAVFSGGTSEQDAQVAKVGLDWLSKLY